MFQGVIGRGGGGTGKNFLKNKELQKSEISNEESRLSGNAEAGVLRKPLQTIF